MAKQGKIQDMPRGLAPPKAANVPAAVSVSVATPSAQNEPETVRARLLSDTPQGRNLPFGLNGQLINVTPSQFAANSDILARA